jgi:hypothetical protein
MISAEGAALVATVYPVAMLVIGLEIRSTPILYPATKTAFIMTGLFVALVLVSLGLGLLAIQKCMVAVSASKGVYAEDAAIVTLAGHLLGYLAVFLMMLVVADRFGILDRLGAPHARKTSKSPRRSRAQLQNIQRFNPSTRNPADANPD